MEWSYALSRAMYHPSHLPGAVPRAIELCTFGAQDQNIFPIIIPYIHWPYLFNSERLQPILIYHQFASAAARAVANEKTKPAFTNRWTTRGDSGRPASSTGCSARGDALFQKLLILKNPLYRGRPLTKKLPVLKNSLYRGRPLPKNHYSCLCLYWLSNTTMSQSIVLFYFKRYTLLQIVKL